MMTAATHISTTSERMDVVSPELVLVDPDEPAVLDQSVSIPDIAIRCPVGAKPGDAVFFAAAARGRPRPHRPTRTPGRTARTLQPRVANSSSDSAVSTPGLQKASPAASSRQLSARADSLCRPQ